MLLMPRETSAGAGDILSAGHQKSKLQPNRIIEYRTQIHFAEEMSAGHLMMGSAYGPKNHAMMVVVQLQSPAYGVALLMLVRILLI